MESFKIANFRLFNEEGVKVNFKPITILTGTNSSGKSSFVKSMILMKNYFDAVMREPAHNPAAIQLDFSDPWLKLSGFADALNYHCDEGSPIVFTMEASSNYAPYPFILEYSFVASKINKTKGDLKSIRLFHDKELMVEAKNVNGRLEFSHIGIKGIMLEAFLNFIKGKLFCEGAKFSEDSGKVTSSRSKSGEDISGWSKFDDICFARIQLEKITGKLGEVDLVPAIKTCEDNGVLMYFPIMDTLNRLTKAQAVEAIMSAPVDDDNTLTAIRSEIASKYKESEKESFIEFFKSIEDEELISFSLNNRANGTLFGDYHIPSLLFGCLSSYSFYTKTEGFAPAENEQDAKESNLQRICRFFHEWQMKISQESDNFICFFKQHLFEDNAMAVISSRCRLVDVYNCYISELLSDILISKSFKNMVVAGNSFSPVQRLYSFEDGSSFVNTVKKYCSLSNIIRLNMKREETDANPTFLNLGMDGTVDYKPGTFTDKWIKELGIASHLIIDDDNDGLGFRMFLHKEDPERMVSVADQGHGISQLISILIQIECAIMESKIEEARGYDAYVKSSTALPSDTMLTIEEPEVSLHPSMQSKLALMFEDASKFGINFIIETHSEYLVRKTQVIVSSMEDKSKNPFCIYYFCSGGSSYELEYTNTGGFVRQFGPGFFDEARSLAMEVINNSNLITEE